MDSFNDEDLESLLIEIKWNNKEATRLFRNEREYMASKKKNQVLNSNSSRENIGWIDTCLSQTESKLDDAGEKFLQWKLLREALEIVSTDNVVTKSSLFEEKRRTASLYNALDKTIATQQNRESQIEELTLKLNALQRQQVEILQKKLENEEELAAANITHSDRRPGK